MANIVELRLKSEEQLIDMMEDSREELFNLRFQLASARLSDMSRIKTVRREIAQLETVLRMRELAIEVAKVQPEVASELEDISWNATANYSYEESAWKVVFLGEDKKELTSTWVNLNKKKARGRRARREMDK